MGSGYMAITNYDPEDYWNTGCSDSLCFEGQMYSELDWAESDVPGLSTNPDDFTGVNEYDRHGDAFAKKWGNSWWESDTADCPTWMHIADNSGDLDDGGHFWVWTDPLYRSSGCY